MLRIRLLACIGLVLGVGATVSLRSIEVPTVAADKKDAEKPMENERIYPKPSDAELRKKLTPMQYKVTQQEGGIPRVCSIVRVERKAVIDLPMRDGGRRQVATPNRQQIKVSTLTP